MKERMEEYTKGPLIILDNEEGWILDTPHERPDSDGAIACVATLADARLFAAAPQLLAACEAMDNVATWLESFFNDVCATTPEYVERCGDWNAVAYLMNEARNEREKLRAAVALARGTNDN